MDRRKRRAPTYSATTLPPDGGGGVWRLRLAVRPSGQTTMELSEEENGTMLHVESRRTFSSNTLITRIEQAIAVHGSPTWLSVDRTQMLSMPGLMKWAWGRAIHVVCKASAHPPVARLIRRDFSTSIDMRTLALEDGLPRHFAAPGQATRRRSGEPVLPDSAVHRLSAVRIEELSIRRDGTWHALARGRDSGGELDHHRLVFAERILSEIIARSGEDQVDPDICEVMDNLSSGFRSCETTIQIDAIDYVEEWDGVGRVKRIVRVHFDRIPPACHSIVGN